MTQALLHEAGVRDDGPHLRDAEVLLQPGLVPNVKRGANNRRVFDERDVEWVKSLTCLKRCDMSIQEMKEYLALCLQGAASIPERKTMLEAKRARLAELLVEVQKSIDYIDWKQGFYDDVLAGRTEYASNLLPR